MIVIMIVNVALIFCAKVQALFSGVMTVVVVTPMRIGILQHTLVKDRMVNLVRQHLIVTAATVCIIFAGLLRLIVGIPLAIRVRIMIIAVLTATLHWGTMIIVNGKVLVQEMNMIVIQLQNVLRVLFVLVIRGRVMVWSAAVAIQENLGQQQLSSVRNLMALLVL